MIRTSFALTGDVARTGERTPGSRIRVYAHPGSVSKRWRGPR